MSKHFQLWRCILLLPLLAGCPEGSAEQDGPDASSAEPEGVPDAGVAHSDAGPSVDSGILFDAGQIDDAGAPPRDAGLPGPCPAPSPPEGTTVIFGDTLANGWEAYGFAGPLDTVSDVVCSGSAARRYTSQQYDGFALDTATNDVAASRLQARIYLDTPGYWAVAAVAPGEDDPHQFIGDETWVEGWQVVDFPIPSSTPTTRWILFEKQDEGSATIYLDDLWLVPR